MSRTISKLMFFVVGLSSLAAVEHKRVEAQQSTDRPSMRVWQDVSGKKLEGTLISSDGTDVKLQKADGNLQSVAIEKFIAADQEYIRKHSTVTRKTEGSTPPTPDAGGTSELEAKCRDLSEQISKGYSGGIGKGKPTIAVVEFSNLSGGVTDLGRFLSEELITRLFATGHYKVIERLLLNKAIAEHKLQLQGLVDPKSAKELGKILGVDAIVSGTIAEVGDSTRVNARLISTETGEILSVAAVTMRRDKLPAIVGGDEAVGFRAGREATGSGKIKLPYREDFAAYKDGDHTSWGANGKVVTGEDGRKWLAPSEKGQKPVGIDVQLPTNAYIEFEYAAKKLESKDGRVEVLSGLTLIDETGATYRIEFQLGITPRYGRENSSYAFKLPGGAEVRDSWGDMRYVVGTVRVRKAGNSITVQLGDKTESLTADLSDFKKFTRFEVDLYKGPNSQVMFTNFKIGGTGSQAEAGKKSKAPKKAPR
ncbi:MAG: CsgG/HfaB family protein [Planctomycetes bacterium]|nr:CsgG/HfaB family protein [Planctomycetota bacterium]